MMRLIALAAVFCLLSQTSSSAQAASTETFQTSPNEPLTVYPTQPHPWAKGCSVDSRLVLSGNATPYTCFIMGSNQPGANVVNGQDVRNDFFMNYNEGNLEAAIGSPMDTGQPNNSIFAAVARHYAVGDPNDLHVVEPDGLHLRAICQNHTNCTAGNVYAAMIRLQAEIRPGMTVQVRYKSSASPLSWLPVWMFQGMQISPGPGGDPYIKSVNQLGSLVQYGNPYEIDINDNFIHPDATPGTQLDFAVINENLPYACNNHYFKYIAEGNGYHWDTTNGEAYEQLPINWSTGFHDLTMSWRSSNVIVIFVDGVRVFQEYAEYPQTTYKDGYDGNKTRTVPLNLIIGNQAIPSFNPHPANPVENDGAGPDGWGITVQQIAIWNGDAYGRGPFDTNLESSIANKACGSVK